jgi:hypothetical protein
MQSPATINRKDEPTIRNPKETEKILSACQVSNLAALQNSLAFNFPIFRDLATIRNFYAHRNEDTAWKVRNKARAMGLLNISHPDELVRTIVSGRPVAVFEDWLVEAQLFFDELTK